MQRRRSWRIVAAGCVLGLAFAARADLSQRHSSNFVNGVSGTYEADALPGDASVVEPWDYSKGDITPTQSGGILTMDTRGASNEDVSASSSNFDRRYSRVRVSGCGI